MPLAENLKSLKFARIKQIWNIKNYFGKSQKQYLFLTKWEISHIFVTYHRCSASFSTARVSHFDENQTILRGRSPGDDSSLPGEERKIFLLRCISWKINASTQHQGLGLLQMESDYVCPPTPAPVQRGWLARPILPSPSDTK